MGITSVDKPEWKAAAVDSFCSRDCKTLSIVTSSPTSTQM